MAHDASTSDAADDKATPDPRRAWRARAIQLVVIAALCQGGTCVGTLPAGDTMHRGPEWAWKRHDCDKKPLPFLAVERNIVRPVSIRAGNSLRHVLIYSLCPATPGTNVRVKLVRRVLLAGTAIHVDVANPFELKPGRWIVTAFIEVPPAATAGKYELGVEFQGDKVQFSQNVPFTVEAARDQGTAPRS